MGAKACLTREIYSPDRMFPGDLPGDLEVDIPRCDQKAPFYDASGQEQRKLWKLPLNLREEVDRLQCNIAKYILIDI